MDRSGPLGWLIIVHVLDMRDDKSCKQSLTPPDDNVCDVELVDWKHFHQLDVKMNSFNQHPRENSGVCNMLEDSHSWT